MQPPPSQPPPPGYSNYYRQPLYGPSGPYGPPEVSFDTLGHAWSVNFGDLGLWGLTSFIALIITYAVSFGASLGVSTLFFGSWISLGPVSMTEFWEREATILVLAPINALVLAPLYAGFSNMIIKKLGGEPVSAADLFSGFSKFGSLAATGFIISLITIIGTALFIVPGIYLYGALAFAPLLVLRQNLSPFEAISRSMETLSGGRAFMMFLLLIVLSLCSGLGAFACGIGIVLTLAISPIGIGIAFNNFFPTQGIAYGYGMPTTAPQSANVYPPPYQNPEPSEKPGP